MPHLGWGQSRSRQAKKEVVLVSSKHDMINNLQGSVEQRRLHGGGSIAC